MWLLNLTLLILVSVHWAQADKVTGLEAKDTCSMPPIHLPPMYLIDRGNCRINAQIHKIATQAFADRELAGCPASIQEKGELKVEWLRNRKKCEEAGVPYAE